MMESDNSRNTGTNCLAELRKVQKCVCCLTNTGPFVNLTSCNHTDFLDTYFKFYDYFSTYVCYLCHAQLRNIAEFKQVVARSLSILIGQNEESHITTFKQPSQSKFVIVCIENSNQLRQQPIKLEAAHDTTDQAGNDEQADTDKVSIKMEIDSDHGSDVSYDQSNKDTFQVESKVRKVQLEHMTISSTNIAKKPRNCSKRKTAAKYKEKRKEVTEHPVFICDHCKKQFITKVLLKVHMKVHFPVNTNVSFICKYCKHEADSYNSLEKHLMQHGVLKNVYICNLCNFRFKNQKVLDDHVARCKTKTEDERKLDYTKNLIINNTIACTVCNYKCSLSADLENHMKTHPHKSVRDGIYECDQCDSEFLTKELLDRHMNTHSDKHMNTHSDKSKNTNLFKCKYCTFETSSRGIINEHLVNHGFKKPHHTCSVCGYRFKSQAILDKHAARCTTKCSNNEQKLKYKSDNTEGDET